MPSRMTGPPRFTAREASAIKASVPPSPLLSARSSRRTYFAVTTMRSAHTISDRMPSTIGSVAAPPPAAAESASRKPYSGLVPMSP